MSNQEPKIKIELPAMLDEHSVPKEAGFLGELVNRISVVFAIGFLLSMSVLIFEIFMRHLFDSPTLWAHETTSFLCAVGFIFGGLFCASKNKHIRVVPIYDNVGPKVKRWLDIIIYLTCAVSTAFFSYAAGLMVKRAIYTPQGSIHLETSGSAWNPPTPALIKVFLLIVLIALTVQFIAFTISHIRREPSDV